MVAIVKPVKPWWHKYLHDPDVEIVVSEDGSYVSIAHKRVITKEAIDRALAEMKDNVDD